MTTASPATQVEPRGDAVDAIAGFMRGFSLEATRPSTADVAALAAIAPAGTHVYVSAVPTRPAADAIEAAARLRHAGFDPVPHWPCATSRRHPRSTIFLLAWRVRRPCGACS